ncbi:DUF6114 domain-containing protein [Streptomyces lydicus]|uniref:DUF6114 domain-containing protein n=1 Tax=Streptomyces lydicus TaxID=47763 RepID=UPI00286FD976|nr:DUF6114 domain-containing protein [Streptomyces lydicus]
MLGGPAALGIGLALMAAGLFLWCAPATHHYVSINALILSVLSFAATNLGGFLVGTALGIAGSAMGFGWMPGREFVPQGFTLAGVEEVPTARGPVRAMMLRMTAASLTDYRLTTHDGGPELGLSADTLHLGGEVTLHLTRFSGCLEGLVCLTFTPDTLPVPPVVPPFVFMTDVDAEQALVTSDLITADGLRLRAGARSGPGA